MIFILLYYLYTYMQCMFMDMVFIMCTTQCMIGSVFTSGVCHCVCMCVRACVRVCVCVFRMFFEKPVLLTVDHWYTAVACVSSPSGASSDAGSSGQREITGPERCSTFTAHVNTCMFMYMYMYYTFVPACLYTQSILDLYMYMYI